MRKKISIPIRSSPELVKELREMQYERVKLGKDKFYKPTKSPRLTLAITRHRFWPQIKKEIIEADLP